MVKITYLGHSSFLIENAELSLIIDPYRDRSVSGLKMPRLSANYVFSSHDHYDHDAVDLVNIVDPVVALRWSYFMVPHDKENGQKRGLNRIHAFYLDGLKIVHLGDTGCMPKEIILKELDNTDVLLGPINGFYTISAEEFRDICNIIKPKLIIPMHYHNPRDNSGYPDGGQIEIFKKLYPNYVEVNEPTITLDEKTLDKKVIIFNNKLQ